MRIEHRQEEKACLDAKTNKNYASCTHIEGEENE